LAADARFAAPRIAYFCGGVSVNENFQQILQIFLTVLRNPCLSSELDSESGIAEVSSYPTGGAAGFDS
jgi:hypothetical protein